MTAEMQQDGKTMPVLFNTEMACAVLEGRKGATRRLVKPQPAKDMIYKLGYCTDGDKRDIGKFGFGSSTYGGNISYAAPPCRPGDILYVREAWQFLPCMECAMEDGKCGKKPVEYGGRHSASHGCFIYRAGFSHPERVRWRPSIHMPKKAARIWLKVTSVEPERLQDIDDAGILEEGLETGEPFEELWDSTIKKKELPVYGWEADPWVWTVKFERCAKPDGKVGDKE